MPTRANQTELDLAWVAGFVDGEGYIGAHDCTKPSNKTRAISVLIDVTQVRRLPLDKLHAVLGVGNIHANHRMSARGYSGGPTYTWRAYCGNAVIALQRLFPFLVLKRRQAEIAIELHTTTYQGRRGRKVVPPEVEARRIALYTELRVLNAKRVKLDAERLNEVGSGGESEHAIVRSHGNNNREIAAEMTAATVPAKVQ